MSIRHTRLEIDLEAIRQNVTLFHGAAGGAKVLAVVKADAYGHGAVPCAKAALETGKARQNLWASRRRRTSSWIPV